MSLAPKRICTYPGCNNLITGGSRCREHPYPKTFDKRKAAAKRGYDDDWRRLRKWYIKRNPVCEIQVVCHGAPAVLVDHIVPLSAGGERLHEGNLQSCCRKCHGAKTAADNIRTNLERTEVRSGVAPAEESIDGGDEPAGEGG